MITQHLHQWYEKLAATNKTKKIRQQLGPVFYQFVQHHENIYWIRSPDFLEYYYINSAVEKLLGWTREELYQYPEIWIDAIVLHDREKVKKAFLDFLHGSEKKSLNLDYSLVTASGKIISLKDNAVPIFKEKQCVAIIGTTLPVDGSSNHASEFFRYFIEKSNTVFWIKNLKNNDQIYINSAYEKLWGLSSERLKTHPDSWYEMVHPEDKPHVSKAPLLEFDKDSEHTCSRQYRILKPDGKVRWIHEKSYPVFSNTGEISGCAGIAEDITEDVLREKELRQAKETAEKANQAKSDFLAMMSHELRTPLNAILGMAQILNQSKLNRDQEGQLEVITQAGNHLLALLNDILDFTKLEVGKLKFEDENLNLYALIEKLISDIMPQAKKKNLALSYFIERDVAQYVISDAKRIQQILTNLLSNAIKYTEKGHVKLKITCLQRNNTETTLCFTVEDSGIGIEKTKIDGIFRRFQQIESLYQRTHDGVGLGLAIVKELVDRMGGSTAVSSELGVGSQFSCILPFMLQNMGSEPLKLSPSKGLENIQECKFNVTVLIVEDNKINQKIAKMMLEHIGCKVEVAENAEQALNKNHLKYDLIFMDLGLPDMDGFQAVQHIRLKECSGKRIPIVAMTAHIFSHDKERCFEVGMDDVLLKPIMRDELVAIVRRWAA